MKHSLRELELIGKAEKEEAAKLNAGLHFVKADAENKKFYHTNETVYRIEFPHQSYEQAVSLFNRMDRFCRRNVDISQTAVILGFSCHKHWTPFTTVSTGGRPKKVFDAMPYYRADPHVHLYLIGKNARSLSERIYKTQSRKMKLKPFRQVVFSEHTLCPDYVRWQSTLYREFGNVESYLIK